jgi:hypothetical protein
LPDRANAFLAAVAIDLDAVRPTDAHLLPVHLPSETLTTLEASAAAGGCA